MKSYLWLFFAFMLVATVGLTFGTHVPAQTDLPSLWSEGSAKQGIIKLVQATPDKSSAGPAGLTEVIAGDAAAGRQVFKKCEACHSLEPSRNLVGPSLAGWLAGRPAQSQAMTIRPR
jgi:mono/diheme cytochrome c family protein